MRSDHLSKHMKRHQNPTSGQKKLNTKSCNNTFISKKSKNSSLSSSPQLEEQVSQYSNKRLNSESSDNFF